MSDEQTHGEASSAVDRLIGLFRTFGKADAEQALRYVACADQASAADPDVRAALEQVKTAADALDSACTDVSLSLSALAEALDRYAGQVRRGDG